MNSTVPNIIFEEGKKRPCFLSWGVSERKACGFAKNGGKKYNRGMGNDLKTTKGIILILIAALMFGSYGIWSRLMGQDFGVFYQSWTRALIIVLVLFPFLYSRKEIVKIDRSDRRWLAAYMILTSLTQAPIFYAFNHMDIGSATLLYFVTMLLTMYLVGFAFLGEKATYVKMASFALALIGMYLVFSFSLAVFTFLAAAMAVLTGIASGGEVSFSKKLSSKYSALYLTWLSWLIIIPTNGIASVLVGETQHLPSFDIVWLYQLGYVAAGIIGFWAIIEGLKYVEASIGGLLGLLEIVFSITFGILIFKEVLTAKIMIGGAVIIIASALPHVFKLLEGKFRPIADTEQFS
jgi:drug/metabolite transporter (DMT)-like permease